MTSPGLFPSHSLSSPAGFDGTEKFNSFDEREERGGREREIERKGGRERGRLHINDEMRVLFQTEFWVEILTAMATKPDSPFFIGIRFWGC